MKERSVVFYVFDDLNRLIDRFTLNMNFACDSVTSECCELNRYKCRKKFAAVFHLDGYFLSVLSQLLFSSEAYRKMLMDILLNFVHCSSDDSDINIKIKLVKPEKEIFDSAWNQRISSLVFQRQEMEHAMSWLSTFGGAFSALGDNFVHCAKVAGKISIQQFKIAFQLGEPHLITRCRLYMALCLIQLGHYSTAKAIVKKQFEVSKDYKDIRLQNMCKGIWAKLQYIYSMKKINSKENVL